MIDVKIDLGITEIRQMSGNGLVIMYELCTLVKAVCELYASDEAGIAKEVESMMVKLVYEGLKHGEELGF